MFAENLPGFPDNIRLSSKGGYWVATPILRTDFMDLLMQYPRARNFLAKVRKKARICNVSHARQKSLIILTYFRLN